MLHVGLHILELNSRLYTSFMSTVGKASAEVGINSFKSIGKLLILNVFFNLVALRLRFAINR